MTDYLIPGFRSVYEALRAGDAVRFREIWVAEGGKASRREEILRMAADRHIPVRVVKAVEWKRSLSDVSHQGIVGVAKEFAYADFRKVSLSEAFSRNESILLVADHITDEGNLGALIRTAAFFGVDAVILPRDRSAKVSPNVFKRSSGGCLHVPVSRVVNLGRALDELKKRGYWIIGSAAEGEVSLYRFDWNRNVALVVGNEERGLSRGVRRHCDEIVRIPSPSNFSSLNVSVAAGVLLGEIFRHRRSQREGPEAADREERRDHPA